MKCHFIVFQIYPREKDAEFDVDGRPFHPFFYTTRPLYNQTLYDLAVALDSCYTLNDRMFSQGQKPDADQRLDDTNLAGTRWIKKEELEELLREQLKDRHYHEFLEAIERLTFQPFSYKFKELIFK